MIPFLRRHSKTLTVAVCLLFSLRFLNTFKSFLSLLSTNDIFRRDLLQDYLIAEAFTSGAFPYLPVEQLADLFLPQAANYSGLLISPHPPTLLPLLSWMPALGYQQASVVWAIAQLVAAFLIADHTRAILSPKRGHSLWFYFSLLCGSQMFGANLLQGQLGIFISLFFISALSALLSKREETAGVFLGLAFAVKLFSPLGILFLLLDRHLKLVLVAATICLVLLTPFLFSHGLAGLWYYLTSVIPANSDHFLEYERNLSIWSLSIQFSRFFAPEQLQTENFISIAVIAFFLLRGFSLLRSTAPTVTKYLYFSLLSVLMSPLQWYHSFAILWPAAVVAYRLKPHYPRRILTVLLGTSFLFLRDVPIDLEPFLTPSIFSFATNLLKALPLIVTLLLLHSLYETQ